jgi:hypothetical protein
MGSKATPAHRSENARTAVGVAIGLVLLAFLSESPTDIAPIAVLAIGMLAYTVADDRYSLPDGTGRTVYGAAISLAGVAFFVAHSSIGIGGTLTLAGLWFVLDGTTAVMYGEEKTEHGYVSEANEDSEEVLSRMMLLRKLYVALRDSEEPQTAEEVAEDLGTAEPRVESALSYLESEGRITSEEGGYSAEPHRWGGATPFVEFLVWLPRRLLRPFFRLSTRG